MLNTAVPILVCTRLRVAERCLLMQPQMKNDERCFIFYRACQPRRPCASGQRPVNLVAIPELQWQSTHLNQCSPPFSRLTVKLHTFAVCLRLEFTGVCIFICIEKRRCGLQIDQKEMCDVFRLDQIFTVVTLVNQPHEEKKTFTSSEN